MLAVITYRLVNAAVFYTNESQCVAKITPGFQNGSRLQQYDTIVHERTVPLWLAKPA